MSDVSPPKWVVFDIGRVLVEWEPDRLYAKLIADADNRANFFARTNLSAVNSEADRGGDLKGRIAALAELYPEDAHLILPWWDQWSQMCHAPIHQTEAFLRRLRQAGTPVCALSNFSNDTFDIARELYPVLKEFDAEVISGLEGVTKPDPLIYMLVEQRTGASGAELFFMDDIQENVEAAQARGWRTHLFDGWDGLAAKLPEVGLGSHV